VSGQVKHTVGITTLVIVPRHKLDEVIRQCNASIGIEDTGVRIRDEIGRYHTVFGVAQNAFHFTIGSGFDGGFDISVFSTLLIEDNQRFRSYTYMH